MFEKEGFVKHSRDFKNPKEAEAQESLLSIAVAVTRYFSE